MKYIIILQSIAIIYLLWKISNIEKKLFSTISILGDLAKETLNISKLIDSIKDTAGELRALLSLKK